MKLIFLIITLLCFSFADLHQKKQPTDNYNDKIKGKWLSHRVQLQYIVDSNLVHEKEIADERGKTYEFEGSTVRIINKDGTVVTGTFLIEDEESRKNLIINLPGSTLSYNLIALTPTAMVWQNDLENTNYQEKGINKSAERAIYTEEFKRSVLNK